MKCPQCSAEVNEQTDFGMVECPSCHHMFMAEPYPTGENPETPLPNVLDSLPPVPTVSQAKIPPIDDLQPKKGEANLEEYFQDIVEFANTNVESKGSSALYYNIEISGIDTPELRDELEEILSDKRLNLPPTSHMPKIKRGVLRLTEVPPVRAAVLVSKLRRTHLQVKWETDQMIRHIKPVPMLVIAFLTSLMVACSVLAGTWEYHDQSLKSYAIRISNQQDDIHNLIVKKNKETDPAKKAAMLEDIKAKYAELRNMHKDFLKEMEHVRYEHPERGDKVERTYHHVKVKTLEELENDNTFDGQLTRLKRKAEMQYQPKNVSATSSGP